MNINLHYIYTFIIGGSIISITKYLSSTDNIKLCCVIPAIPIFFPLTIYFMKDKKHNEINRYIRGYILSFTIYVLFLIIFYYSYNESKDILNGFIISFIFFILFIFIIWKFI